MDIQVEHVRSFARSQTIPLRRLNILVGENSSGKSTFLAVIAAICDQSRFPWNPAFNEPPYSLGNFDTIATYKGGKYGRDHEFTIGFKQAYQKRPNGSGVHEVAATYCDENGRPILSKLIASNAETSLTMELAKAKYKGTLTEIKRAGGRQAEVKFSGDLPTAASSAQMRIESLIVNAILHATAESSPGANVPRMFELLQSLLSIPFKTSFSFSPIRSRPRRTYDELSEEHTPEGDHIPSVLLQLLKHEPHSEETQSLREALERFGQESGLFRDVNVRRLGSHLADPFQIQVSVGGPAVNLADVGYGVSQSLPIVVQTALRATSPMILMQQPEVHLHPRGQAALGTFFADLVKSHPRTTYVIETHSDYLLDRIRQEIAQQRLPSSHVQILFFSRPQVETTVYPIQLDSNGNIENAPAEYRRFFLEEEINLFNRTSSKEAG